MNQQSLPLKRMLRLGHHEAVVTTVGESGEPHAAAMGVKLVDEVLVIHPYTSTRTYRNIRTGSAVSLAFTHNALVFCDVVMRPSELRFREGRKGAVYVLDADVDFYIEAEPKSIVVKDNVASVSMTCIDVYRGSGEYFPYSRANSMLIEALVYFTKIRSLASTANLRSSKVSSWLNVLRYSISIVDKLGSRELVECANRIQEELKSIGIYQ